MRKIATVFIAPVCLALLLAHTAGASALIFSTGAPDGLLGSASRPSSPGKLEIESADDFLLTSITAITQATFAGLLPAGVTPAGISDVVVEIYRVFPNDSTVPPSTTVPTRVNSPSDVAFDSRSLSAGTLTFSTVIVNPVFSVSNTVVNGINEAPNQNTHGEGPATGQEVRFDVTLTSPFILPADHYFFIPQVRLSSGDFLWLSSARPIASSGTPFNPDLQSWIRNENLDPNWLRIGTDIIGPPSTGGSAPTFNASFTLIGVAIPEPSSVLLAFAGVLAISWKRRFA